MKIKRYFTIILMILFIPLVSIRFHMKPYFPEKVEFSYEVKDNSIYLTMKSKDNYKIYYTLDGSIPSKSSYLYTNTIKLDRTSSSDTLAIELLKENSDMFFGNDISISDKFPRGVVVRAIAIAPDKTKGEVNTETFFPGLDSFYQNSTIISLVTDPKNLLDYHKGIMIKGNVYDKWMIEGDHSHVFLIEGNYTQKGKEWERDAVVEFFDSSLESSWKEDCGIRIRGSYTRKYIQKGFNIYFRKKYGSSKLKFELFPNNFSLDGNTIEKYKSFMINNGTNTADGSKYADSFIQSLVSDRNVDTQANRLVVVFLNGEYWGVYDLKERYDEEYYNEHYQIHRKNLIVISENIVDIGKEEDISYYHDLMKYSELDLTNDSIYQEFLSKIDLQSMLDYFAIQIYIENDDWGTVEDIYKNVRLWRARDPDGSLYGDGKWRWSLFDEGYYASSLYNSLDCPIQTAMLKHLLFASAMKNEEFQKAFYKTYEDLRISNFKPSRVESILNTYIDTWNPYLEDQFKRFGVNSYSPIRSSDQVLEFFQKKYQESVC